MVAALGAHRWLIPDGYLPVGEADGLDSHEAVCVLNTGTDDAHLELLIYLEDAAPIGPFEVVVPGERTKHVRTDHLETDDGRRVPRDVPYAVLVTSDVAVTVQHSRMDVRSPSMTLMTTAAIPAHG
jgi:hypothetical protein